MLYWIMNRPGSSQPRHTRKRRARNYGAVRLQPGKVSRRIPRQGRTPLPTLLFLLLRALCSAIVAALPHRLVLKHYKSLLLLLSLLGALWPINTGILNASVEETTGVNRHILLEALEDPFKRDELPETLQLQVDGQQLEARINYSMNPEWEDVVHKVYTQFRPDYAAFVALDPTSGEILCMVDYVRSGEPLGNLVTRATFPAASIMKIVTAAAAIDLGKIDSNSVIGFNGDYTKLLKPQVLEHTKTKWTRLHSLEKAFALSMNPVFGRIGVEILGYEMLAKYVDRFGFDRSLRYDVPVATGSTLIRDDAWQLAQVSSGYTRTTKISPLHGAMVAATIANNGRMPVPSVVNTAYDKDGLLLYVPNHARRQQQVISAKAASEMRKLMRSTVRGAGTAKSSFKDFFKGRNARVEVGGKTGSLSGTDPRGRNDWFVGYAALGERKVAFASLNVNKKQWRVKSAQVARVFLEAFFDYEPVSLATNNVRGMPEVRLAAQ